MASIEERARFDSVRYANCWEDSRILGEALEPAPGKRLLSIGSAGDNSLYLLAGGAEVVAVDLNPAQVACLELRREAIRHLEHAECLAFLGITASTSRLNVYGSLKDGLSGASRSFWEAHRPSIAGGIVHAGRFERYFQTFRKRVLTLIHSRGTIRELLREKPRAERQAFYRDGWDNRRWRLLFRVFFSRTVMGRMGRDPEFFRYVEVPVSESILARTRYALTELSTHDNPYLAYILTGNFGGTLPDYLEPRSYARTRANLDGLRIVLGPVQKACAEYGARAFDGYNLSDIFEYLDSGLCAEVYTAVLGSARPGARVAYWNMLVPRGIPENLGGKAAPLPELSRELFRRDRAFFYSDFLVDRVH